MTTLTYDMDIEARNAALTAAMAGTDPIRVIDCGGPTLSFNTKDLKRLGWATKPDNSRGRQYPHWKLTAPRSIVFSTGCSEHVVKPGEAFSVTLFDLED